MKQEVPDGTGEVSSRSIWQLLGWVVNILLSAFIFPTVFFHKRAPSLGATPLNKIGRADQNTAEHRGGERMKGLKARKRRGTVRSVTWVRKRTVITQWPLLGKCRGEAAPPQRIGRNTTHQTPLFLLILTQQHRLWCDALAYWYLALEQYAVDDNYLIHWMHQC